MRRNVEGFILNYFQTESLEKAELMLKLVRDAVKKRKNVAEVLFEPKKMGEKRTIPNQGDKIDVQKAG